jgi:hypothetical protein
MSGTHCDALQIIAIGTRIEGLGVRLRIGHTGNLRIPCRKQPCDGHHTNHE